MESLNNRTYIMPEADTKPFCPAASDVASDRFLHTLIGLANNKAVTTFIAVICFLMTANISAQTLDWVKTFGGDTYDLGRSLTVDADGNVYTTGYFSGTVDFDPGPDVMKLNSGKGSSIFIQKLDANGNFLWAKSCAVIGIGIGAGFSITIDEDDNIYTTGYFSDTVDFDPGIGVMELYAVGERDIFILKLDANGNFLWAKSFGGKGEDFGYSIAIDANGNVYTTGYFSDTVDFDPGPDSMKISAVGLLDAFIQKLDANGNLLWVKSFGEDGDDVGFSIKVDAKGNVYTTGFIFARDIFIQKLDTQGNFLWAKFFVGNNSEEGKSIVIDEGGNIYTTGSFSDTIDFDPGTGVVNLSAVGGSDAFIQKLDPDGNFLWAKSFGGRARSLKGDFTDQVYSIAIDVTGSVYTTGYFSDTVDFDPGTGVANLTAVGDRDAFIQKLDTRGNFLWAKSFGGKSMDVGFSINVDAANNIYTTGYFSESVDFDPGTDVKNLTSVGREDIFVHKMKQTATGVADMGNGIDISLYPNPSNGFIHIALNEAVGEAAITITDLQGKIIHSEQMSAATKSSMDIQAPNGVYFVHVKTANGQSIMKFIKE